MKLYCSLLSSVLAFAMLFACGKGVVSTSEESVAASASATSAAVSAASAGSEESFQALTDPTDPEKESTQSFSITPDSSNAVIESDGSVYTIRSAGEYTLSGYLENGQIIVDAEDEEVKLVLSDASISCSFGAPILILSASDVSIKADSKTYNTVSDLRTGDASSLENSDENYDAAIYAACDLSIAGKGTLIVTSSFDNGIKSKDDLSVKNVTMKVTAPGNALKGNDSVEIKSGELILISTESDGVKTVNSDLSSKGKQRGTVSILDGHVDIYAARDGISAAYNVEISEEESCVVSIYTSTYSDSADSVSEQYLIVPSSLYSDAYDYYAYFYNEDDSSGLWVKCTYETMVSGGRSTYYGLAYSAPAGYQNILFVIIPAGTVPDGSNHTAGTSGDTRNESMNGYLISGISGSAVYGDWVQLSKGNGNSGKTTYSSKGIKAENEVIISGGAVAVYAGDDGIHANAGEALENGSYGVGNVTISAGSVAITCSDDGIHADNVLTISGGTVTVTNSHEGLEANVINLAGGTVSVYANDDGLNACSGSSTPLVNITGGIIDVTTPSGDTDAIDSNGSFAMSGGFLLVRGGSTMGMMAGSVDTDGSVVVTGGTVIAFGGICTVPSGNSVNVYISNGTSFSAGTYSFADSNGNVIAQFSLSASYSSVWIASDMLKLNGSYQLTKDGSSVLSWTQNSSQEGSAGNYGGWGGGRGGFGGRR